MFLNLKMVQDPLQFQLEPGTDTQCEELNGVYPCMQNDSQMKDKCIACAYSLSSVSVAEVCVPSTVMLRLMFISCPRMHSTLTPSVSLLRRLMPCGGVLETAT